MKKTKQLIILLYVFIAMTYCSAPKSQTQVLLLEGQMIYTAIIEYGEDHVPPWPLRLSDVQAEIDREEKLIGPVVDVTRWQYFPPRPDENNPLILMCREKDIQISITKDGRRSVVPR
jgi:hypothetical protein